TGVWMDERGRIVRPGESAWTSDRRDVYGGKELVIHGDAYVAALRDWGTNGGDSPDAVAGEEFARRVTPRAASEMRAGAAIKLAGWFQQNGDRDRAAKYSQHAQELNPDDWNYHRQDWSFEPNAGRKWLEKFQRTDKEYYPLDIKPDSKKKRG